MAGVLIPSRGDPVPKNRNKETAGSEADCIVMPLAARFRSGR